MVAIAVARPVATSANGVLSLLDETETKLRVFALHRLNEIVDQFWPEIAEYLPDIEALYEEAAFSERELAALVASKVFYHLEQYDEALRLALGAGKLFDLSVGGEYVDKVVAVALDEYVRQRVDTTDLRKTQSKTQDVDPRLEAVVQQMFARCLADKAFTQGLGMAIECRRLDKVKEFIVESDNIPGMLDWCQKSAITLVSNKTFREQVISVLVDIYNGQESPPYDALCQCYYLLYEPDKVAKIFGKLIRSSAEDDRLLAYQIGFDIADIEDQKFCEHLLSSSELRESIIPSVFAPTTDVVMTDASTAPGAPDSETTPVAVEAASPVAAVPGSAEPADMISGEEQKHLAQLRRILSGRASIDLHLEFLYRNNRSDLLLLETVKGSVDQRNSITHNATIIAHGLMQCGTTSDVFLRKNLEWLAKAHNWAKFTATASLGVIHKGHIKDSRSILSTYLPSQGGTHGSPYSEGGALYAMGLIHAHHHDNETKQFLVDQLRNAQSSEVLQHGACLGIGLVCMATADEGVYEDLYQILCADTAVAGEAAAYAIGLVMVGSASEKAINELIAYAHDTQHEKIIRACSLALAMIMFKREEEAESLIERMLLDKDAILRYGACFCTAMAYCGTSTNSAIRRLLHVSVSDVSDDVRRAAVIALGFVMCNVPEELPNIVRLLCESYNPHVRYAAALALGVACAGSANLEAHNLLQPLVTDASDFVRQGAIIALGLLYMQTAPGRTDRVKDFRAQLLKIIADKHEDVMTRFGAILANGVLDAGGRNCSVTFFTKNSILRPGTAIGFCLFTQMWYWFPLIHMFSLTLTPTALIGLNENLKIPKNFSFMSKAKPSLFAYPEPMMPPKKEETKRTMTAVLSTAAKAKALKEKKDKEGEVKKTVAGDVDMETEEVASARGNDNKSVTDISICATQGTTICSTAGSVGGDASDMNDELQEVSKDHDSAAQKVDEKDELMETGENEADKDAEKVDDAEEDREKEKPQPEPTEETLHNPCRVLPAQMPHISFTSDQRYVPLLSNKKVGFLLLRDLAPDEPEELLFSDDRAVTEEEKEPDAPEPFEWTE